MAADSIPEKKVKKEPSTIYSLQFDILFMIFSYFDVFNIVQCTAVCKSWNEMINDYNLLEIVGKKILLELPSFAKFSTPSMLDFERFALRQHRLALQYGQIEIHQWKNPLTTINKCRMRRGMLLTSEGDKGMRLWSMSTYKSIETYFVPDNLPLIDFDFDGTKIIALAGNQICTWNLDEDINILPAYKNVNAKCTCVSFKNQNIVIGFDDGNIRVFDLFTSMHSTTYRMKLSDITCLDINDRNEIFCGSSDGHVGFVNPSLRRQEVRLRTLNVFVGGVTSICYNPVTNLVFAGTNMGYVSCWDVHTNLIMWSKQLGLEDTNVISSMATLRYDSAMLIVGADDGIIRVINQRTGLSISWIIVNTDVISSLNQTEDALIEKRKGKFVKWKHLDMVPKSDRPSISCIAVGIKKIVTTHNDEQINVWKLEG